MTPSWLLLISSNFREKYFYDILETIGAPSGYVVHFRYKKNWVDPLVWQHITLKGDQPSRESVELAKKNIIILFLDQDENNTWKHLYPIRFAKLADASHFYKTGNQEHDTAHFYLSVDNYCYSKSSNNFNILGGGSKFNTDELIKNSRRCVHLHGDLDDESVFDLKDSSESSFMEVVKTIDKDCYKIADTSKIVTPVFHYISGFVSNPESNISKSKKQICYSLEEGKEYILESSIFLHDSPGSESFVELLCHEKRFENQSKINYPVAVNRDEYVWQIFPGTVAEKRNTVILLQTNVKLQDVNLTPINVTYYFSVEIIPNLRERFVETVRDSSFLIATTIIGLIGLSDKLFPGAKWLPILGYMAIPLYILGVIAKIFLQWRGKR